jgi:chaperonin GroES
MGTTALAAPAKTAVASSAKVAVNGVEIAPTAYTIDGYTFFKLRDVAAAVANTAASFDVAWDATAGKIALHSGISYAGAMEAGQKTTGEKAATLSTAPVLVNGKEVKMEVAVGDKVITNKYAGTEVKLDGVEYIVLRQADILAKVED